MGLQDRPKNTPLGTLQLLCRADHAGEQIGALCRGMHREHGETAVRRILGVLSLAKKYGVASVDDACAAAFEVGSYECRCVRRYLERQPQLPLSSHQVDPLIRQLTEYRDSGTAWAALPGMVHPEIEHWPRGKNGFMQTELTASSVTPLPLQRRI